MAYGTIKVNNITFDDGGSDQTVTVSGLYNAFTNDIAVTGTISGTTVTGTTANFVSGVFTTQISGTTVTGTTSSFTTGNFTTLSGATATFTSGVIASGTATNPSLSFVGDPNTGIFSPGADQVAVATNGSERLRITSAGNVGIGTSAPSYLLDVNTNHARIGNTSGVGLVQLGSSATATQNFHVGATGSTVRLWNGDIGAGTELLRINSAGLVGIGTTSPGGTLDIKAASAVNPLIVQGPSSEFARIDSSGRLLVGTSTTPGQIGATATTVIFSETGTQDNLNLAKFRASDSGPGIQFVKSRGTSPGTNTIVVSGDQLGLIRFAGGDGTNYIEAASITAAVDETPGTNDMPGRLVFSTTAAGASSPTERMRISSDGLVTLSANAGLSVSKTGVTSPAAADGNVFSGTYTPTLTNTTNVSSSTAVDCQYMRVGNVVNVSGQVTLTPTSASTQTLLGISLPIASSFTLERQAMGTCSNGGNKHGRIVADSANNRLTLTFSTPDTGVATFAFNATYRIV
jgi:hypothetical protein